MATDNLLYHVDSMSVDGAPIAIEDGTGRIIGATGSENEVVASGSGDDFVKRKRIARQIKAKIQFGAKTSPDSFSSPGTVQIALTDKQSGRRCLATKCSFASMGEIGDGSVDVTYNVLAPLQWL